MISAISAALREHLARRPAQDIPALQASPKDWRPATCAIAAHIPRYATAHLARCRRCTPPTASIRSAAQAVRPMPAAARAADISAARDVVRGVCHGVHAVHVVAHDVCYVSRALHISCLPCAATVPSLPRLSRLPWFSDGRCDSRISVTAFRQSSGKTGVPVARCEYGWPPA